jgi:hypothetical protein
MAITRPIRSYDTREVKGAVIALLLARREPKLQSRSTCNYLLAHQPQTAGALLGKS